MCKTLKVHRLLLFLFFLIVQSALFAKGGQITLDAPAKVWTNERFAIVYTIESDEEIEAIYETPHKNNGISILSGPVISRSVFRTRRNASGVLYKTDVRYVLQSGGQGRSTLPGIEIVYKSKKEKSVRQIVEVISLNDTKQDDVAFIKTSVSRNNVKPGDTLSVSYKLFTTMDINRVSSMDILNMHGLSMVNTTSRRLTYSEEEIDGRSYKVVEVLSLIIQPEKDGNFTIPGGQLQIEFSIPTGKLIRDFWGKEYEETINKSAFIPYEEINIKAYDLITI